MVVEIRMQSKTVLHRSRKLLKRQLLNLIKKNFRKDLQNWQAELQ